MERRGCAQIALLIVTMLGVVTSQGSVFENLANFLNIHVDSASAPDCPTIIRNATYGTVYSGNVSFGQQYVFQYYDIVQMNETARVSINSSATLAYPLQCAIREQTRMQSWEIPFKIGNDYWYNQASQSLCPDLSNYSVTYIEVEVMTMSKTPVQFSVLLTKQYPREIGLYDPHNVTVKPSEPAFYLFRFPENMTSVVIKAESLDTTCLLFSIQNAKRCPIDNLVNDLMQSDAQQTVTKKGAITITKDELPNFYIVLVLLPDDEKCTNKYAELQPLSAERKKFVNLVIEESISETDFIIAITVTLAVYVIICLLTFLSVGIAQCVYRRRLRNLLETSNIEGEDNDDGDSERELLNRLPASVSRYGTMPRSAASERRGGATGGGGAAVGGGATAGGGATGGGAAANQRPDVTTSSARVVIVTSATTTDAEANGVEGEYDLLRDAEDEKHVVRTRTQIFVADLSRKDHKRLHQKFRMYWCNLITVLIFYGLPVIQLVLTLQQVVNTFGTQDDCYYNFYCAHRRGMLSSFNNVFSNIGYIMLGFLFFFLAKDKSSRYRQLVARQPGRAQSYGIPQHFGLFYAMGIGLMTEGLLSACYHVCPNKTNYQFDTAFMFITASLCMLKIYQTRHADISPHAYKTFLVLALITILILFGVTMENPIYWIVYSVLHILCFLYLTFQIYYMGSFTLNFGIFHRMYHVVRDVLRCSRPQYPARMVMLLIANCVNIALAIFGSVTRAVDFATYIVSIFIVNLTLYLAFYIFMKLLSREAIPVVSLLFIGLATLTWGSAFYFFFASPTSWEKTPAQSRVKNMDCIVLNFYDNHDIWHFLSALAMFFSFLIVLTLDDKLSDVKRTVIPVF